MSYEQDIVGAPYNIQHIVRGSSDYTIRSWNILSFSTRTHMAEVSQWPNVGPVAYIR